MRAALIIILLAVAMVPARAEEKPAAGGEAKNANVEWRAVDVKDVPAAVKKALIDACDKLVGDDEVKNFTYYRTSLLDTADTRFKATFRTGGKRHVVTCTPAGEVTDTQSTADPPAPPAQPAK